MQMKHFPQESDRPKAFWFGHFPGKVQSRVSLHKENKHILFLMDMSFPQVLEDC